MDYVSGSYRRSRSNFATYEEALTIGTRYSAKSGDTPSCFACTIMKLKGKKEPRYSINADMVKKRKGNSRKGKAKSFGLNFLLGGGSLDLMVRFAIARIPAKRKATDRIAHPKPILVTRWFTMIGRTTPPRLEPAVTIPKAMARCRRNHVPTAAIAAEGIISYHVEVDPRWTWGEIGGLTSVEEERATDGTTEALGQKNLVILLRYGGHHQAKNM